MPPNVSHNLLASRLSRPGPPMLALIGPAMGGTHASHQALLMRERLAAFPTQLALTLVWIIVGVPLCIWLRSSILWVSLMSVYAIIVSHFTAHTAWKAERAAEAN